MDTGAPHRSADPALSRTTLVLHWIVGLGVLGMLASGYRIASLPGGPGRSALVQTHKSFGLLVLCAALARAVWRVREGWPPPLAAHHPRGRRMARGLHLILLAATLAMPLSGIGRSLAYGRPVALFGWPLVPQVLDHRHEALSVAFSGLHDGLAMILAAGIGLHVAAALKHHLVERDDTLRRILGLPAATGRDR